MTKSLPNLIKSNYVIVTDSEIKVIDSNLKNDMFSPIVAKKIETIEPFPSPDGEEEAFVEGLFADQARVNVRTPEISLEKAQEQAKDIIENAVKEAETIKERAKQDASAMLVALRNEAQEQGYNDGFQQGEDAINAKMAEIEEKENILEEQYDHKVKELEDSLSDIIIALVKKITGVLVEEKKDIIQYLISEAISNHNNSSKYMIRVSKEDYHYVVAQKDMLQELVKEGVILDILEDSSIQTGDCIIETDKRMIDCSIDTKLNNLTNDLKYLS